MLALFAFLSVVFNVAAYLPYFRDIFAGKTKPHRTTWFIYFLLTISTFSTQLALGASGYLWLLGTQAIMMLLVFLLSIKYGVGGFSKVDIVCLIGALAGLLVWWVLNNPAYTLYLNIGIDIIATIPTIVKAWRFPETETASTWALGILAAFFSILAAHTTVLNLYLGPLYTLLISTLVTALIIRKHYC